ncbi:hypothetical protein T03_3379 [Trichinella britovi]|uniref:Uncharacterized protein n=1 Tax=Trichinella britovi TaxID=45882 RepID=A0A0V0YR65_TRIBR|nr:hypothetical protein T03_3379 [Trichinella britovi]
MRSFWSLSTNDHFHPAYYNDYMCRWMASSEDGKYCYVADQPL